MQIVISNELQEQMIEHAKKELPNECCGYITGAGDVCKTFYPMVNVDASPVHFSFDPKEQFKVIKDVWLKNHSGSNQPSHDFVVSRRKIFSINRL